MLRPLTAQDILNFWKAGKDVLAVDTATGEFLHVDTTDYTDFTFDTGRNPWAYDFITLDADSRSVQLLLEASTVSDGEWFPDAMDEEGDLKPGIAEEMALVINMDGLLPPSVRGAILAEKRYQEALREAAEMRALKVAAVVAYCDGNQSEAARLLELDPSTVNKLVKRHQAVTEATEKPTPYAVAAMKGSMRHAKGKTKGRTRPERSATRRIVAKTLGVEGPGRNG